jgi:hypothetical protein
MCPRSEAATAAAKSARSAQPRKTSGAASAALRRCLPSAAREADEQPPETHGNQYEAGARGGHERGRAPERELVAQHREKRAPDAGGATCDRGERGATREGVDTRERDEGHRSRERERRLFVVSDLVHSANGGRLPRGMRMRRP